MSRIYDARTLQTVPFENVTLPFKWNSNEYQKGNGVLVECSVINYRRLRITDSCNEKVCYYVFNMKIKRAHSRKFDSHGKEIEPNFSETHKVSTGYLPSSYKTEAKGLTDNLDVKQLHSVLSHPNLVRISGNPADGHCYLWIDEVSLDRAEFSENDEVRVKTAGDGPFIESICKLSGQSVTVSNYSGGESVGTSWTDKIMAMKRDDSPSGQVSTADDIPENEWSD